MNLKGAQQGSFEKKPLELGGPGGTSKVSAQALSTDEFLMFNADLLDTDKYLQPELYSSLQKKYPAWHSCLPKSFFGPSSVPHSK